jgi:PAS domain S-box-containing protein
MLKTALRWVGRYAIAFLTIAAILLLRLLFPFNPTPLLIIAIVLSAWFGNVWQGLLSAILVEIAVEYFFETPPYVWDFGMSNVTRMMVILAIALLANARKRAEVRLKVRAEQQQALAEIGQRALEGRDLRSLMNETAELIVLTFGVKRSAVFERQPNGDLLLSAGAGWGEGTVNRLAIPPDKSGETGQALLLGGPVTVYDHRKGNGLPFTDETAARSIRSSISVSIPGASGPLGVVAAYHNRKRKFSNADVSYLQTLAHVLAEAHQRKRAEEALREQREWLRVTISSIGDAVIATDAEARVAFINPVAETLTGWKMQEADGRPLAEIFNIINEDTRQPVESPAARVMREGLVAGLANHTVLIGKDGVERPIDDSGAPIKDRQGNTIGVVLVFHDVSERRQAEAALRESEHRFRQLAENVREVFWMSDLAKSEILYVSPAYGEVWGRTTASLYNNPLSFIAAIHPEDRSHVLASIDRQAQGHETEEVYRVIRPDGSIRWVRDHAFPVKDETGKIYRLTGIAEDITARKQIEDGQRFLAEASTLLASSLDYETMMASLARLPVPPDADFCVIEILEQDGQVRRVVTAHKNSAKDDLVKKLLANPPDLKAEEGITKVLRAAKPEIVNLAEGGSPNAGALDPGQSSIIHDLGASSYMILPILARGRMLGAMTFFITESNHQYGPDDIAFAENLVQRIGMAIDNARLYSEAQEANRVKDEFLATVSHELRTPLNAITGWVAMLRRGALDDEASERALHVIDRNAKLQTQIVSDILDVSRIITGKLRIESKPVDLAQVIESAIEAIRPAAEAKSIQLEKRIRPGVSPVLGDVGRLQQIVWNLLSNGIKFTPRGGRVEIGLESEAGNAIISVIDSGIGIRKDFLPLVFDRFLQADGSYTRVHGGLGLGLSIVRHLVEMHGGEVIADSAGEGLGATFIVRLPHADIDKLAAYQREQSLRRRRMAPEQLLDEGLPSLDNSRILVVDDEPDTRDLLKAIFSQCGAQVEAAATAQEALDILGQWGPDLMVCDIGLPVEDGFELIKKVRGSGTEKTRYVPALALTGYARIEDQKKALSSGFQMFITKPVDPAHLTRAVEDLLKNRGEPGDGS